MKTLKLNIQFFLILLAFTSTTNQTSVDYGAAGTNGGGAVLHVTAVSGTSPTLDAKIQTSSDNASFIIVRNTS